MTEPVIRARGVDKVVPTAEGQLTILDGIDLEINAGETVAVVGASGSGKTTLLGILAGLDLPTSGTVTLVGRELTSLDEEERARVRGEQVGFVFQTFQLLGSLTALENVMLPAWGDEGRIDPAIRRRAAELLDEVGLSHRMHHRASGLSGGEQQRVAIARALVRDPLLVLSDEPTGNLDTVTSNEVFELMRRFNRERHTTFLVVTHDPRIAARCGRVIEIVDGRIVNDDEQEPVDPPGTTGSRAEGR